MSRTLSWSPRVGEVWTHRDGSHTVEVVADHARARLVLLSRAGLETEWVPYSVFEAEYVQGRCGECDTPTRVKPVKAVPGSYCTKPCCATRHAPPTC